MIVGFDIETTGLDKYNDRIIEIALVKFDEKTFEIYDTLHSLINPEVHIPEVITSITNISDDDVLGAPKIEELIEEISAFIGDLPVLGHNVDFDIDFFVINGINIKNNIKIDTFFLANILNYKNDSLNLEMLCLSYQIPFEGAHRAINDTKATIKLFEKQVNSLSSLRVEKKQLIHYIFGLCQDRNIKYLEDLFFSLFSEKMDFDKFEGIIMKKIGRNTKKQKFYTDENLEEEKYIKVLDNLDKYEDRQNQKEMISLVSNSYKENKKVVIEAPTGLGKSFAYLIPAIVFSVKNNAKIYISTKTKTLQDQLFFKDLEFLKSEMGIPFSFSKLKGKNNYISLKLFFEYILLGDLEYSEISFLIKITFWLLETKYGELDEINIFPFEQSYLKSLTNELNGEVSEKNNYHNYEFLNKAREGLTNANITVINNNLLFLSLEDGNTPLPNMKYLVIDEAHSIEDSATESLKETYSYLGLKDYFNRIDRIIKAKNIKKLEFQKLKESILSSLLILDDYSASYINNHYSDDNQYKSILITDKFFEEVDLGDFLKKIRLLFQDLIDYLKNITEYDFTKELNYFEFVLIALNIFFDKGNNNEYIKILGSNERYGMSYAYTLYNPGLFLKNKLWDELNSVILTSATLSIGGDFKFFKKLLSLVDFEFYTFESDFDYKNQATLFIPTDIGDIRKNSKEVSKFLLQFYKIVKGNTLTLFTSFQAIRGVYTDNNGELKKEGINLYAQSVSGSRTKLLSFYKNNPSNSILLGTDSFWEGIDIPGEDLKYLIIYKFPFQVPTEPIFQARTKMFVDSFTEYSLPKAVIKLKQGFGRLIRTKNDKGLIVLLDNRIDTTRGQEFYGAFPKEINIKRGSCKQFLEILEKKYIT